MAALLTCPRCGAQAMTARDKRLWLEPSRAIPCARCGERLSLPYGKWLAGGLPAYLLLFLVFTGLLRSWPPMILLGAFSILFFLVHKVRWVPLVPARRSASTAYPWRAGRRR